MSEICKNRKTVSEENLPPPPLKCCQEHPHSRGDSTYISASRAEFKAASYEQSEEISIARHPWICSSQIWFGLGYRLTERGVHERGVVALAHRLHEADGISGLGGKEALGDTGAGL